MKAMIRREMVLLYRVEGEKEKQVLGKRTFL